MMEVPPTKFVSGDAGSIRAARSLVRSMLGAADPGVSAAAELLTDELATNAVRHGGGWFAMRVSLDGRRLRVSVSDQRASSAVGVKPPGHAHDGGRGLMIVAAMASSWGVDRTDSGKAVWFELEV